MANASEKENTENRLPYFGRANEKWPTSIKEALANGELPKEWLPYFEKWCQWAKETDDAFFWHLKFAYSLFEYNGKLYDIRGSTFGIEDYQFEYIEERIKEDLIKLGVTSYFYHGMLD